MTAPRPDDTVTDTHTAVATTVDAPAATDVGGPTPPVENRPDDAVPPTDGPRRNAWVAVLVTLVGGLVVLGLIAQAVVTTASASGGSEEASYTAAVDGVTELDLEVAASSLTVSFANVPEATLDVTARGWGARTDWVLEVEEGVLRVADERDGVLGFWPSFGMREVEATLVLPDRLEGQIDADIDLSAGDIDLTGDVGALDLDVSAGSLTFTGASESLVAEISAGSATVVTDGPATVDVDVSAGRFIGTVTGTAPTSTTIDVSAGGVQLLLPEAEYALAGEVSAGDRTVDVRTDPTSPNLLRVDVSAGDATVGYSD